MNTPWYILFLILLLSGATHLFSQANTYTFYLSDESNFQVDGTTNVVGFSCKSNQYYNRVQIPINRSETQISFEKNTLKAKTKALDCGGSGINGDMYKTLKADTYPTINIELKKITFTQKLQPSKWINSKVEVYMTVAGKRNYESFTIKIMDLQNNNYKIQGKHTIYLTNYNISPPKAMLGLISVKNEIELVFDLQVNMTPN
ncbi:MAG: YceI family protein [Bacteroidetes bacterium]|nr:YceI family protein [Bacteroidota bacterium]MBP7398234.1 YceI family protein [Chitinophagales bacterium]MBP9704780.1 YceI family protein [Chitinophagales bacterium]